MKSKALASFFVDQVHQSIRFDTLVPNRIRDILLVSSLYDSYIFMEDGSINDLLYSDYDALNLRYSPRIDRVSTAERALTRLGSHHYDLVISMLRVGAMDVSAFGARVHEIQPDLPVLLLAFNAKELSMLEEMGSLPGIDKVFVWSGDTRLFLAMVKYAEDHLNAWHDSTVGKVQIIILIEDSIRFYSSYLPLLYTEIMNQTQSLMVDGLNKTRKLRRQHARPKVLLASTYEEGAELFDKYHEYLIGTIIDASFPRNGLEDPHAGLDFAKMAKQQHHDLAVLLQSSEMENESFASRLGVAFINKESPTLLNDVRNFMKDELGFGDFVFRRPDGSVLTSASDLRTFCTALELIPDDSLMFHGQRKDFSTWLRARTEFDVARAIRDKKMADFNTPTEFRRHLITAIKRYQTQTRAGIVSDFSSDTFEGASGFVRIGSASLGGKGRGLAFFNSLLESYQIAKQVEGVQISVPPTVVLATDVFDQVMEANDLSTLVSGELSDEEIDQKLLTAEFPEDVIEKLRVFLSRVNHPLAVRSSSLLEDASHQPFAGIYRTFMIPNNSEKNSTRLGDLMNAIRLVYASTFQTDARSYLEQTPNRLEEEKMAVVIQQVVGRRHDNFLYPDISGVARSHNFYPTANLNAEDGVICPVLGLGKMAVEGGRCLRFSPERPLVTFESSTSRDYLNNAQRNFYALDLSSAAFSMTDEGAGYHDIKKLRLEVAHQHGTFEKVGSVYSPRDYEIFHDAEHPGVKLVTMAGLFGDENCRLPQAISFVLKTGQMSLACPVEIEFAATYHEDSDRPFELSVLQIRPIVIESSSEYVDVERITRDNAVCVSHQGLGHGSLGELRDLIYVKQASFDRSVTNEIADEIGTMNVKLKKQNRSFILIGPGRWGSEDPCLGIPVSWSQISKVRCIVETPLTDIRVSPSQGSHFFQNITSFGIGYFTMSYDDPRNFFNFAWLDSREAAEETPHVRHIAFDAPLDIFIDSSTGISAIMKPGQKAPRRIG